MQNGFHRLISSDTEDLPYSSTDETMATGWIDAERYRRFHQTDGGWNFGYWLRGNALFTSEGQTDVSVAALAVASHGNFDAWAGLRQDWRSGYVEPVQRVTAEAEEDLAISVGMRFGSLVLETVQQLDNDASFGQLRLLSQQSEATLSLWRRPRFGIELGFLMPDVHLHLAGRIRSGILTANNSQWHESVVISADLGEPQLGDDASIYIDSTQLTASIEWERPIVANSEWLGFYASVGAGWREERLLGDRALAGLASAAASEAVALFGAGLRFHASTFSEAWRYRIQIGATAWLPMGQAEISINGAAYEVLQPNTALSLGVSFEFR
jgi:hypothetical protein